MSFDRSLLKKSYTLETLMKEHIVVGVASNDIDNNCKIELAFVEIADDGDVQFAEFDASTRGILKTSISGYIDEKNGGNMPTVPQPLSVGFGTINIYKREGQVNPRLFLIGDYKAKKGHQGQPCEASLQEA